MRTLRILLAVVCWLLASTSVFALDVGYNQDIHNGTGQDAYDFHVEGTLQSAVPPEQIREFCFSLPWSPIDGFDWEYDGGSITPLGGDLYHCSASWSSQSGTVPVGPGKSIHIGQYFDETCHNVLITPFAPGGGHLRPATESSKIAQTPARFNRFWPVPDIPGVCRVLL